MRITISGKNLEVSSYMREVAEKKLSKLERYFPRDAEAQVTLSVERNRHIVEVTIPVEGRILRGEEVSDDMYASFDNVVDKLEKQIVRHRTKLAKDTRGGETVRVMAEEPEEEGPAPDTEGQSSAASSSLLVATSSLISSRLVSSCWSGPKRVKSVEDLTPHTLARKRRRVASPLRLRRRLSKPRPSIALRGHRCLFLDFGVYLEFGVWILEFRATACHHVARGLARAGSGGRRWAAPRLEKSKNEAGGTARSDSGGAYESSV